MKVLEVMLLPSSEVMLSTQALEGMLLPDHWVPWASKNSSCLVPVKSLSGLRCVACVGGFGWVG